MKNALQSQLLKAGLVDSKKAKKLSKQAAHAKRTGDDSVNTAKKAVAEAQAKKLEKDQKLNHERQQALEQKTFEANIIQMIKQHQIGDTAGEIEYKFVDGTTIKKLHISQQFYDQIVAGHLLIAKLADSYALLPHPLAQRIQAKIEQSATEESSDLHNIIISTNKKEEEILAEDDPYADYVIPDDLMW